MHDARITAQLSYHPFVLACSGSARWGANQEEQRNEHQGEFVHGSRSLLGFRH
jgi:hypothetical protein